MIADRYAPRSRWRDLAVCAVIGAAGLSLLSAGTASATEVACKWGDLSGDRVLLCPRPLPDGSKAWTIVKREPAEGGPVETYARPADAARSAAAPRALSTADAFDGAEARDDGAFGLRPSARVGVNTRIGGGPNVGVGVGLPSGRISAGVGTSIRVAPGVSIGTGVSVPIGDLF